MKKILTLAAVAATMAFFSSKVSATQYYPNIPVNLSFTVQYNQEYMITNKAGTVVKSSSPQTVSINNKSIIYLLNLFDGANIPPGSYLAWNPWEEYVYVTNSSGFYYNSYDIYLEVDYEGLPGQATQDLTTRAGTEKDLTSAYLEMYFNDYNYFYLYSGLGTMDWTYGTASGTNQPVTLSTSIGFTGGYEGYYGDNYAVITSGKFTGSGKGTDPIDQFPFYLTY